MMREQRQEIAVIELFNPEYDSVANTLRYDITAENATTTTTTSIDLPGEFGQSTLVIDDDGDNIDIMKFKQHKDNPTQIPLNSPGPSSTGGQ